MKNILKRYLVFVQKAYFMVLKDGFARANFLRKHRSLGEIGDNVYFYSRIFPADPKLLKIHNNVVIATNVRFLGHDRVDIMLSGMLGEKFSKKYGCIEIMDNVFIGADVVVLPDIKIGENTIIGAGAVITHDLEPGFIWGGVPANKIGEFQTFIDKRKNEVNPENNPEILWKIFDEGRK